MAKTLSADERLAEAEATAASASESATILQRRNAELAGYEGEARSLRDTVASLQAKLDQATSERDSAVRDAAVARADALSASQSAAAVGAKVAAAESLARSIKELSK